MIIDVSYIEAANKLSRHQAKYNEARDGTNELMDRKVREILERNGMDENG